jgi:hypothetical protein
MANVFRNEKREQVLALGRLGWPLRRIDAQGSIDARSAPRLRATAEQRAAVLPAAVEGVLV